MTLDEAIKHAEEVADYDCYNEEQIKCAEEHRQLAEWLKDYKRLLELENRFKRYTRQDAYHLVTIKQIKQVMEGK